MTTLVETSERISAGIYQRLSGDASLTVLVGNRIYRNVAPQGTAYPLITFSHVSQIDLSTVSGQYVMSNELWQVKVAWQGLDWSIGRSIADRVLQLLHGHHLGTIDGVHIAKLVREQVIPQPTEYVGGVAHQAINHQYRTWSALAP